jgi:hypothetical protein
MLPSPDLVFDEIDLNPHALGDARMIIVRNPSPAWRSLVRERADE